MGAAEMKERPILFSAPMVRAILEGRKTMTRRAIKPQPVGNADVQFRVASAVTIAPTGKQLLCPYGVPGDRLWVRETWARFDDDGTVVYRADANKPGLASDFEMDRNVGAANTRWRPSIHMHRRASRITLEVAEVRVERLQDVSESDAITEGAPPSHPTIDVVSRELGYPDFSRSWFAQLWESINGPGSWDANPWVWVVGFKRVTP